MTQGQGANTAVKERGFGLAFSVSLSLSGGANVARFPYWHVDLNAGSGWNERAQCDGSPIVFLNLAESRRPNYRAFFCDHNPAAYESLCAKVGGRAYVFPGDNSELLPVVSAMISQHERNPRYAVGTVVCDPNGYFGKAVPHMALQQFAADHPRIDLIFNLNVRIYQLGKAHITHARARGVNSAWLAKFWPSPYEFPALFGRKHWLLSRVASAGGDRFVVMIGRNFDTDGSRAIGHYRMDSEKGAEILREISGAGDSLDPFGALPNVRRVPAAPGLHGRETRRHAGGQLEMRDLWGEGD